MEIYLDSNIILGWFKFRMKHLAESTEMKVPYKLKLLSESGHDLFISSLVKAEIFRYLKTEWHCNEKLIMKSWKEFIHSFGIKEVESRFCIDLNEMADVCLKTFLGKRTIIDILHIMIAKKEKMIFLTDDFKLKRLNYFYSDIFSFSDLISSCS